MDEDKKVDEKRPESGDEARIYEIGYLLIPAVGDEGVPARVGDMHECLERQGGVIISEDLPTLKNLSYIMERMSGGVKQKYDRAYFGWIKFEMAPESAPLFKKEIDEKEEILRFMIIQTVRENTMMPVNPVVIRRSEAMPIPQTPRGTEEAHVLERPLMTEEELDKTIEELVIE